jgi:hypothetical protein
MCSKGLMLHFLFQRKCTLVGILHKNGSTWDQNSSLSQHRSFQAVVPGIFALAIACVLLPYIILENPICSTIDCTQETRAG